MDGSAPRPREVAIGELRIARDHLAAVAQRFPSSRIGLRSDPISGIECAAVDPVNPAGGWWPYANMAAGLLTELAELSPRGGQSQLGALLCFAQDATRTVPQISFSLSLTPGRPNVTVRAKRFLRQQIGSWFPLRSNPSFEGHPLGGLTLGVLVCALDITLARLERGLRPPKKAEVIATTKKGSRRDDKTLLWSALRRHHKYGTDEQTATPAATQKELLRFLPETWDGSRLSNTIREIFPRTGGAAGGMAAYKAYCTTGTIIDRLTKDDERVPVD